MDELQNRPTGAQSDSPAPAPTRLWKKSFAWRRWLLALMLLMVMGFFLILAVSLTLVGGGLSQGAEFNEYLEDGEASAEKKIVAIPIQGVIMESMGSGPGTVSTVKRMLKAIQEDKSVVGVLLVIDSPGGGVTASDRIYHDLLTFKDESKLPVHSLFLDISASGGYYVAMASDHITAHPTTVTGSIGVISQFFNASEAMNKVGVSVNVIKSLNDKGEVSFKDIGSPYRPMSAEERALLQSLVTEMWERFTEVVSQGREGKLTAEQVRKLADGRVFTGEQALELKLVDAVGYTGDSYREIRKASGYQDAKIVTYRKEPTLARLLGLSARYSGALEGEGVVLREILSGHSGFLYLWTAGGL